MEIKQTQLLADELIIQYIPGWKFKWSVAKAIFGRCSYSQKTILISKPIAELNEEADVRDTILHEIAHALVGMGHGHDQEWKRMAIVIGCKPERCYTDKVKSPAGRYIYECPVCKNRTDYHRTLKLDHSCIKCSSHFNPEFLLKLVSKNG